MHRKTTWRLTLSAVGVAALAAALLPLTNASASAPLTPSATDTGDGDRYKGADISDPNDGFYRLQTNLWNRAVRGGFTMDYDQSSTAFTVHNNTANSYWPNGQPLCWGNDPTDPKCNWAGTGDPWLNPNTGQEDQYGYSVTLPSWVPQQPTDGLNHNAGTASNFGKQIHAPASYPSIYSGCHWGTCSNNDDIFPRSLDGQLGYFPGQARLPSLWNVSVPTGSVASAGAWDASYDIWLDTNSRPVTGGQCSSAQFLPNCPQYPGSPASPGQNDGAEIMIWVNHNGYNNANTADNGNPANYAKHAGTIQPAGIPLLSNVSLSGIRALDLNNNIVPVTFDIWGGRVRSFDNGIRWNVISFVARTEASQLIADPADPSAVNPDNAGEFDTTVFMQAARNLSPHSLCSTPANTPLPVETVPCVGAKGTGWWITSIQAGFEIWYLPSNKSLTSRRFRIF